MLGMTYFPLTNLAHDAEKLATIEISVFLSGNCVIANGEWAPPAERQSA